MSGLSVAVTSWRAKSQAAGKVIDKLGTDFKIIVVNKDYKPMDFIACSILWIKIGK